jgi:MFS family permease
MTRNRWFIFGSIFLARTALAFQFQSVTGVSAGLKSDLGFGLTDLGILIGAYMLPGIFVSIPGGRLGATYGEKQVAFAGLLIMAAGGAITAMSDGIALATAGRIVAGIGGVTVNVLLAGMVADWFRDDRLVTAMALLVTSWPLGIGIALVSGPVVGAAAIRPSGIDTGGDRRWSRREGVPMAIRLS